MQKKPLTKSSFRVTMPGVGYTGFVVRWDFLFWISDFIAHFLYLLRRWFVKIGPRIYEHTDGRWEARYRKGRKADGSIIYGSVYGRTYEEAERKRAEILRTRQLKILIFHLENF